MTVSHPGATPAIGVLDGDGLHLPDGSLAPIDHDDDRTAYRVGFVIDR